MGRCTVVNELKTKGLPSFGTALEKRNRLRGYFGLAQKGNVIEELNQRDHMRNQRKMNKYKDDP